MVNPRALIRSAQSFWVIRPGHGEIREEPIAEPGQGQVLVQASYGAVSRGTESIVFTGRVPASERTRMRCPHQEGDFPGPVKYGYSSVGQVIAGDARLLGRTVFCLYPHQTAYVVSSDEVVELPDGVPAPRAVLTANMETALNALWDARPMIGDRVSIVGAGVVGCLCGYLASRLGGIDVELVDVLSARDHVAHALGVRFATPDRASRGRDIVFHASGTEAGLRQALSLCENEGTVIELSWYGDGLVSLPLGEAFHPGRLTLRSSQVGTVSPNARARFTRHERLRFAAAACADPRLDALFDGESAFETLPRTLEKLASRSSGALCHRIRYT